MADDDDEQRTTPPTRPPGEGIRIIGAEEAASALETGAAEGRRPPGAPRFGDVPTPPPRSDRPPALRFPLEDDEEEVYGDTEGVAGTRVEPPPGSHPLQHWTEPATGEIPAVLAGTPPPDGAEEAEPEAWRGFARAPRWRDSGEDWGEDELGDASVLADDETRLGALSADAEGVYDEPFEDLAPPPTRIRTRPTGQEDAGASSGRRHGVGRGGPGGSRTRAGVGGPRPGGRGAGGRDNTQAVVIGLALAAVYLLFSAAGPKFLVVLAAVVVVMITAEIFAVLRRAGYKPATLLGLVATVAAVFGCYWKGERAIPLVAVLMVIFTFLWYLAGVVHARPTVNIAASVMAFAWGGLLGAYAGLLLRPVSGHPRWGVSFLMAAVVCTVVNDVVAYVAGQAFGRTPLAPNVSPGKTWEGFGVAFVATVLTGAGIIGSISPFSHSKGLVIGLAVGVVAPLGDLAESMVKRDIGLKDMGAALPGHGGLADRFDGLLFALPTVYYLIQVLHVGGL